MLGSLFWNMSPAGDECILSEDYIVAHLVVTSHSKRETFRLEPVEMLLDR